MLTDAEKIVAAKVLKLLAEPQQDREADDGVCALWSHGHWDMDEDELRDIRSVCIAFAKEHGIDVSQLPQPD